MFVGPQVDRSWLDYYGAGMRTHDHVIIMAALRRVAVVGAGISGLSVATVLQSNPTYEVTLLSELFSPHTTSDKAGGILAPYALGVAGDEEEYIQKETRWFRRTFEHMMEVYTSDNAAASGVTLVGGCHMWPKEEPELWYKDIVLGCRVVSEEETRAFSLQSYRSGWYYQTFLVDCRRYLPWLMLKFKESGGRVVQRKISSFAELKGEFDIAVNCTGLGSCNLANDSNLTPVFGQLVSVHAPWLKNFINCEDEDVNGESHILVAPRSNDVIIGGVAIAKKLSEESSPELSKKIMENACRIMPSLKDGYQLGEWAGLRPCRSRVRLEVEKLAEGLSVVHNYGHGGNGVNYSWGCALDVRELIEQWYTANPQCKPHL